MVDVESRYTGRRVGVLGLGVSGRAMVLYLLRRGAVVTAFDDRAQALQGLQQAAQEAAGGDWAGDWDERLSLDQSLDVTLDGLAVSPGVSLQHPTVLALRERGVPVCGELDLVGPLPVPTIAVTGTNGKSTTVALLGALLRGSGCQPFVGGNFGTPICAWLDAGAPGDVAVLELSSYQLETVERFAVDVGVLLNLAPDHLARHGSMEVYGQVKGRLLDCVARRGESGAEVPAGIAIVSWGDRQLRSVAEAWRVQMRERTQVEGDAQVPALKSAPVAAPAAALWWLANVDDPEVDTLCAANHTSTAGAVYDADRVRGIGPLIGLGTMSLDHPSLLGAHNRQNAAAAWLAVQALADLKRLPLLQSETPTSTRSQHLSQAYQSFAGLAHRLQTVGTVDGVRYINDSKATNDASAAVALRAVAPTLTAGARLWLLVGGQDKGSGYHALSIAIAELSPRCTVLAFGEAAPGVVAELGDVAHATVQSVDGGLTGALEQVGTHARCGDTVLLAPACASFDAFANFEVRGRYFADWVRQAAHR